MGDVINFRRKQERQDRWTGGALPAPTLPPPLVRKRRETPREAARFGWKRAILLGFILVLLWENL